MKTSGVMTGKNESGRMEAIRNWSGAAALAVGCGLLVGGVCIPPPGEIDNSLLVAFGEIATFAGSCFRIREK